MDASSRANSGAAAGLNHGSSDAMVPSSGTTAHTMTQNAHCHVTPLGGGEAGELHGAATASTHGTCAAPPPAAPCAASSGAAAATSREPRPPAAPAASQEEALSPAVAVAEELLILTFACLDLKDIAAAARCCSRWCAAAAADALWEAQCDRAWKDKVYVPRWIVRLRSGHGADDGADGGVHAGGAAGGSGGATAGAGASGAAGAASPVPPAMAEAESLWRCAPGQPRPRDALRLSLMDATRTFLTENELVSFTWWFRFREAAGDTWAVLDPWWTREGNIIFSFRSEGHVVERVDDMELLRGMERHWEFCNGTGQRTGPRGSFVRVNNFPGYVVGRHPKNWGFFMRSCWVVYTSWHMPPRPVEGSVELALHGPYGDPHLADDALDVTSDEQAHEIALLYFGYGGMGLVHIDEDRDSDDDLNDEEFDLRYAHRSSDSEYDSDAVLPD